MGPVRVAPSRLSRPHAAPGKGARAGVPLGSRRAGPSAAARRSRTHRVACGGALGLCGARRQGVTAGSRGLCRVTVLTGLLVIQPVAAGRPPGALARGVPAAAGGEEPEGWRCTGPVARFLFQCILSFHVPVSVSLLCHD